jgi:hypothetical protein
MQQPVDRWTGINRALAAAIRLLAIVVAVIVLAVVMRHWDRDSTQCTTDTECAEMFGGNGDPEPEVAK